MAFWCTVNGERRLTWYWALALFVPTFVAIEAGAVTLAVVWTNHLRVGVLAFGIAVPGSLLAWRFVLLDNLCCSSRGGTARDVVVD